MENPDESARFHRNVCRFIRNVLIARRLRASKSNYVDIKSSDSIPDSPGRCRWWTGRKDLCNGWLLQRISFDACYHGARLRSTNRYLVESYKSPHSDTRTWNRGGRERTDLCHHWIFWLCGCC